MKIFAFSLLSVFALNSCILKSTETFIPPSIIEQQPSWDGNLQNSGLINYIEGAGFVITPNAAQRYKFLTEKFGDTLVPPIKKGQGLKKIGKNYLLSIEYMSVFIEVSRLNKQ